MPDGPPLAERAAAAGQSHAGLSRAGLSLAEPGHAGLDDAGLGHDVVNDDGLSDAEARARLLRDGPNEIGAREGRTALRIVAETLKEPMLAMLLAGGAIYLVLGNTTEAVVLLIFALASVLITLVQDMRSERVIEALRDLSSPRALVIRGGERMRIAGREVVVGDVMVVAEGDRVAADADLLRADHLEADESLLTGESQPVRKQAKHRSEGAGPEGENSQDKNSQGKNSQSKNAPDLNSQDLGSEDAGKTHAYPEIAGDADHDADHADDYRLDHDKADPDAAAPRESLSASRVHAGTLIVRGQGRARVIATGRRSAIGRIGETLQRIEPEPPRLRQETRRAVHVFALLGLTLSAFAALLYGLTRGTWLEALLAGIALGMSMLPEEFPVVLTVFMAMGAWRISRAKVLTRRAAAIETLGSATVLCTDKTGTLTQNRMTISAAFSADGLFWTADLAPGLASPPEPIRLMIERGMLASAVEPFDPMERAFHDLAREFERKSGPAASASTSAMPRTLLRQYALSPDLLAMTQVWRGGSDGFEMIVAAKGAPEAVADLCGLNDAVRADLHARIDAMAADGLRVLGVAHVAQCAPQDLDDLPSTQRGFDFTFLGLVGLSDPLRANAQDAVRQCRAAGIRVVMITGDYPVTARTIARDAGIDTARIVTGSEIASMSDAANDATLAALAREASVFARITPDQKLRIVEALKRDGEIVAMIGDGVNDAPSLKAAHIGVAMGQRGTDVAREASSIVLLNDDFGALVDAVRLGRRIYDNIRKAMGFIFAVHIPIAGMALLPLVLGWPIVLWPLHIAFLEMVIDPVCSLVFEAEKEESDVMTRPPRDPAQTLFSKDLIALSLSAGLLAFILVAAVYAMAVTRGLPDGEVRSLAFFTLILTIAGLVLASRRLSASLGSALLRPNLALVIVTGMVVTVSGLTLWVPVIRDLFRFGPLHGHDMLIAFGAGFVLLVTLEGTKGLLRARRGDAGKLAGRAMGKSGDRV